MIAWICARLHHLVTGKGAGYCNCHCLCNSRTVWEAALAYERSWLTRDEAFRLIHNTKEWERFAASKTVTLNRED